MGRNHDSKAVYRAAGGSKRSFKEALFFAFTGSFPSLTFLSAVKVFEFQEGLNSK